MAGPTELDNFVKKFLTLWHSGRHARLFVESQDGNAIVNLQLNLGEAELRQEHVPAGQRLGGGGGPARQRRRERRAASRQEIAAAEEVAAVEKVKVAEEVTVAAQAAENVGIASEKEDSTAVKASEEENGDEISPIPQVDGAFDIKAETECVYELIIDAHETCTSDDIIEAIETNFWGALDEMKDEENDDLRNIVIQKQMEPQVERKLEDKIKNLQIFRVVVKKNEVSANIIEGWNGGIFDDLAFKNAVIGQIKIDVTEVQRLG